MGLSASQARLLTITTRKSDCEFQSMRYSHEKIALSRDLTEVSNEYQNALNATKLVYDFYGDSNTANQLSYSLLMTPSEINGYMPMLSTTAEGRVVLNSAYAMAAKRAGIPQEGLGCLPSSDMRNRFYDELAANGLISHAVADTCKSVEYSQDIGMGAVDLVSTTMKNLTLDELLEEISNDPMGVINLEFDQYIEYADCNYAKESNTKLKPGENAISGSTVSIKDLFNGDYIFYNIEKINTDYDHNLTATSGLNTIAGWDGWEQIFTVFERYLGSDETSKDALQKAREAVEKVISRVGKSQGTSSTGEGHFNFVGNKKEKDDHNDQSGNPVTGNKKKVAAIINGFGKWEEAYYIDGSKRYDSDEISNMLIKNSSKYIGYYGIRNDSYRADDADDHSAIALSISNILKYYLTEFYANSGNKGIYTNDYINKEGVTVSDLGHYGGTGSIVYSRILTSGDRNVNRAFFVDKYAKFDTVLDTGLNTEGSLVSGAFDAMFNQIAMRGWTENNNINDPQYLQEMYQNGKMFLTTCTDDGYYYQGSYSTNSFIKEITDEDAIARAEAKYNTEKQKINHKEEILDLKMKNLDTEISSLTTEYDTVKSLITKNIEKGFKRYEA